jgi:phosphatidate cytidylyltransferase
VSLLSLWEYFRIVLGTEEKILIGIPLLAFITGPLIIWTMYGKVFNLTLGLLVMNLIVSGLVSLTQFKSNPRVIETIKSQLQGIIYVPLFLLLLCLIFAGDISAYYFGSYLGRHKLAPAVSPGKTIEGSIGGLAANLAVGSLFKSLFFPGMPWITGIIFFLIVGIMGQAGDLFESELKRVSNIKDSGGLLPGHGGFLDRIDALLFAAPVVYFFKEYVFQA